MIRMQPSLRELLHAVADVSGIPVDTLVHPRRRKDYGFARMAYCWLAREFTGRSWTQIASIICRDRTSAMHAAARCQDFIDRDSMEDPAQWALDVQQNLNLVRATRRLPCTFRDEGEAMRAIWA